MLKVVLGFAMLFFVIESCFYDSEEHLYPNPPACDTLNVSYNLDVNPILMNRCYNCHGNNNTVSVYEFEGYLDLINFIEKGKLLGAVKRQGGFLAMPQGADKIPDCEISILEAWINQGKKNN